jgi:uncharacterized protein involved in exopolysaccharide biosynthesis
MPDLIYLFSKWWKHVLAIVIVSVVIVWIVLLFKPVKYLSVATAVPASSYASDKASIFNNNIQLLYPAMGTPDDLDMIVGTAQLDTVYMSVAQQLNLAEHYKVKEKDDASIRKAAYVLKANTRVIKSDFSELKVKCWDCDKNLAAQMANAIMDKLSTFHQDLQGSKNSSMVASLGSAMKKLQENIDSLTDNTEAAAVKRKVLQEQLPQYEKLITEYQLLADNKPPVLITVERARASQWPDKPKRFPILAATFALSILFSLLLILVLEKRKTVQSV